jgi:hypothetical protein
VLSEKKILNENPSPPPPLQVKWSVPKGILKLVLTYIFSTRDEGCFLPEFNIRLYDKNSESDYYFFPPPKSEYFFQQHWKSDNIFRKKNITPPGS